MFEDDEVDQTINPGGIQCRRHLLHSNDRMHRQPSDKSRWCRRQRRDVLGNIDLGGTPKQTIGDGKERSTGLAGATGRRRGGDVKTMSDGELSLR
jgi:hypothetical protein